ncbi:hypothetical protein [Aridibaculum aurantiacum]|uniref:hypothetical protein n=1 Tax=Aridibaculum aurantiacum TaxID=2810307 RepID=UPI001A968338|nr:hypothetical protein [Aridibaculum aurantiacum]
MTRGTDSFELRILVPSGIANIISIRSARSQWYFTKTSVWETFPEYEYQRRDTTNYLLQSVVDSAKTYSLKPKLPLPEFIDTLNRYLDRLPYDLNLSETYAPSTGTSNLVFEVATKDKYKFLKCYCRGSILTDKAQYDHVENLLNYLRKYLDAYIPNCN